MYCFVIEKRTFAVIRSVVVVVVIILLFIKLMLLVSTVISHTKGTKDTFKYLTIECIFKPKLVALRKEPHYFATNINLTLGTLTETECNYTLIAI